tara:strand:- start:419 stop:622 length:204 start_codon:yes stop_codon:yes gene_type:complete
VKVGDIIRSRTLIKSTGVMGSKLTPYKEFQGYAIVLKVKKRYVKIMKPNYEIIDIKISFLEIASALE